MDPMINFQPSVPRYLQLSLLFPHLELYPNCISFANCGTWSSYLNTKSTGYKDFGLSSDPVKVNSGALDHVELPMSIIGTHQYN